uniref:protein-serine/threonine phosphatase n=1 Tax=Romanomermis culicivorax TaxID=13658 RepID=A0A915JBT1_ROMCU
MSRVASFGQISEITNYLYLSGVHVIKSDLIKKRRIVCIVNATAEESLGQFCHVPGVEYMKVRVDDSPNSQICTHFDSVADKIKSVQDRGFRTLVHCVAGVSRSATLCIAYLIKYENMALRDAYYCVKQIL